MAATVSAWAKPGAWALDSEEHEDELLQQHKEETETNSRRFNGGRASDLLLAPAIQADFPSLSAAGATKTKKKRGQTFSLAQFTLGAAKPSQAKTTSLADLPTGPREWTAEELDRSRLGGGFRSNSRYSSGGGDDSSNPRWGNRDSDEPRRQGGFGRDSSRELAPSRADETDDWGATKKSTIGNGFERRERRETGGFFDSQSRADESDSWVSKKSFVPSEGRRFGSSGGGGGGAFDSIRDRRGSGGFETNGNGIDSDTWGKKKEFGGGFDSIRERRGGGFESNGDGDSQTWGKKREEGSVIERPKLNLKPRTLPVVDGQQNGSGGTPEKPKGSNPFGEARPREEVLKEKGQDWKEIDDKLESLKIKEISDGPALGKRSSFGNGDGRAEAERSWRKTDSSDTSSPSGEKNENGIGDETEVADTQA